LTAHLGAFLAVSVLVIVVPGPDTALTIRNSLLRGRRAGVLTAAGVASGQGVWAVGTAVGIASVLRASQPAFSALRLAGAAYLICLGIRALVESRRSAAPASLERGPARRFATPYGQGIVSNLANPKMVVFFLSLLPQYAGAHGSLATPLGLGFVFCSLTFLWLTAYAAVVARLGDVLRAGRLRTALDRITGAVLVALGLRLAAERV
jgi:threonine/homoserine/homoserine lactone efflux protein